MPDHDEATEDQTQELGEVQHVEHTDEKVESKADQVQPQRNSTLKTWPPQPTTGEE